MNNFNPSYPVNPHAWQYQNVAPSYTPIPSYALGPRRVVLNGAIVQSINDVTADCVPMDGSIAVFPRQDLSEIYVKSWKADGTINTMVFKPEMVEQKLPIEEPTARESDDNALVTKIDDLIAVVQHLESSIKSKPKTTTAKKEGES